MNNVSLSFEYTLLYIMVRDLIIKWDTPPEIDMVDQIFGLSDPSIQLLRTLAGPHGYAYYKALVAQRSNTGGVAEAEPS